MTWKTSDYVILLLAGAAASNLLMAGIFLCRGFFERKLEMKWWNLLLKLAVSYLLFVMPVLSGYILYTSTFHGVIAIDGMDFTRARIIGNRSISALTRWGNHGIFIGLIGVWGIGILYFGFRRGLGDAGLLKKIEKFSKPGQDVMLASLKTALSRQLKIKRPVTILRSDIVSTPFTIGLLRCKIFLPQQELTEAEAEFILKHELIHCKRRDYAYRKALALLAALYWFNPILSQLLDYCVEVNEMACDEAVLDGEPKEKRRFYAEMMIQMAAEKPEVNRAVCLTGQTENGLERRIRNIMKRKKSVRKPLTAVMFCSVLAACPFTSFAASKGISYAQSVFVDNVLFEKVEDTTVQPVFTEHVERNENRNIRKLSVTLAPRSANWFDTDVDGKELVVVDTVYLSTGNEVSLAINGDNTTDKFQAGLMNSSGSKQYVSSSKGNVFHKFTINKSGYYDVYVEGTTNSSIHVSGSVTIFN